MKILVTDGITSEGAKILTDAGHQVDKVKLTPEELLKKIGEYDCIIVRSATKVTKEVIEAGKNLKVIARGGVGLDNIDVPVAESKGIKVLNTPAASISLRCRTCSSAYACCITFPACQHDGNAAGQMAEERIWRRY